MGPATSAETVSIYENPYQTHSQPISFLFGIFPLT